MKYFYIEILLYTDISVTIALLQYFPILYSILGQIGVQ